MEKQKKNNITPALVADVKEMLESGVSETVIRKHVRDALQLGKSRANEVFNEVKSKLTEVDKYGLLFASDGKVYNVDQDVYIVSLKCRKSPLVISGAKHRAICRAYSAMGENLTCHEVCTKFSLTPEIFNEYRKIFSLVKEREPLSEEELLENTVDQSAQSMLEQKRYAVYQEFEKESWKETQYKAKKWDNFQFNVIDPFSRFIDAWQPKYQKYKPVELKDFGYNLIAVLSDCHYGCGENSKVLFRGNGQSTEYTVNCIKSYYQRLLNDIKSFNTNIESLTILSLGDIIHTSNPYSQTTKGTNVRSDLLSEEMFEVALNSLTEFIYNLSVVVPKTKIIACKGNHAGTLDLILFKTLSVYFKDQDNIEFQLVSAPAVGFRERNTFCIASHGAHDHIKAKFGPGNKLQPYIQSLIIHSQEKYKGITSRAAFFADLHHSEMKEFNDFTYHLCPSVIKNDEYSDALGLASRSAQTAFLLDDKGIKATLNYYFD